jgi:2-dehydropantoate 2-reductase
MLADGLQVESVLGDFSVYPVRATDDPAQVGPVDAVLVAVKTWHLNETAQAMRPLLGPETFVVPFLNGVEATSDLAAAVGAERVLIGMVRLISFISAPGHIRNVGGPASVAFGEPDNHPSERVERLRAAFARAGVTVEAPDDIRSALWEKFLFVASLGGLGAVTRAPVGVLRTVPETRAMLERAMREILAVARANHIQLEDEVIPRTLAFVDGLPATGTASLQRDIADGRPSELNWWSGAVVRLGQQAGVPTPVHEFICHSLLPQELAARGQL